MTSAIHRTDDHWYSFTPADGDPIGPWPGVTGLTPTKDLSGWQTYMAARCAIDTWAQWAGMDNDRQAIDWIAGAADRHRDEAARIGSLAHDWCEHRALGTHHDPDPEIRGHAAQFEKFLTDWNPTYRHVEAVVFNTEHRYAGTLDAIADIPGYGTCLLDIKTGKTIRGPEALQLAAYANATFIAHDDGTTEPLPHIDHHLILHLRPRSHHLLPLTVTADTFVDFLYSVAVHRFMASADRLVGDELHPPLGEVA